MTAKHYSAPDGLCAVPGCNQPRHHSRSGKVYSRCTMHYRQNFRSRGYGQPPTRQRQRSPSPAPDAISVMVIDWKTEQVFRVIGVVDCAEPFPSTDGAMKRLIAQASQTGVYVAYIRAWKEEDLYE